MNRDEDEFRVTLRVRNNQLLTAIEKHAGTVGAFARLNRVSPTLIGDLVNMKQGPLTVDGEWRAMPLKLADILGVLPEDLFPPDTRIELAKNVASFTLDAQQAQEMLEPSARPDALLEHSELKAQIQKAMASLTRKEQQVLTLRFGLGADMEERTLDDVASIMGRSRERIRQTEAKALRKLRGLRDGLPLLDFAPEGPAAEPEDSFSLEEWTAQAVEQGLAEWIEPY